LHCLSPRRRLIVAFRDVQCREDRARLLSCLFVNDQFDSS
jgi:hypothetical protein